MGYLNLSLRQALLVPYVSLSILLAIAVGWLTYAAGVKSVDQFAKLLSSNMVLRINQSLQNHLLGSNVVLDAVAPEYAMVNGGASVVKFPFTKDFKTLEPKLWMATGLITDPNNYLYFAPIDGRFLGVLRNSDQTIEVREKKEPKGKRDAWRVSDIGKRDTLLRSDAVYEPDTREWYKRAKAAGKTVWTAPYTSFTSRQLIITKARPIKDDKGELLGVLAADVSLNSLSDFLSKLSVSANGVAYIVERSGGVIASSSKDNPATEVIDKKMFQINLNDADSSLMKESFMQIQNHVGNDLFTPINRQIELPKHGPTYVSALPMQDKGGLNWLVVVAVPRADFMGDVQANVLTNVILIGVVGILLLGMGLYILNWVSNDVRRISAAASRLSKWEKATPIKVNRKDEIGDLARSFYDMEKGLMLDALSGLLNREALRARMNRRLVAKLPFSVLFLDLNLFKYVNDTYGHEAGDIVLRVTASRMLDAMGEGVEVARLGGDEFVIVFTNQGTDAPSRQTDRDAMAAKIDALIRQPIVISDAITVGIGTSIGAANYPEDGEDVQTLLKCADERMYAQKKLRDTKR